MNTYTAIIILNPNISKKKIDFIQSDIINFFEQNTKVQKVWFLGRQKLDHKIEKYTEGLYLKMNIVARNKKIEKMRKILKDNQYIIFSIIIDTNTSNNYLPALKKYLIPLPVKKIKPITKIETQQATDKVYMLVSKNLKLPFSESDILAISTNEKTILQYAIKTLQEYIYVKGYHTNQNFKYFTEVENELKRNWKVELILGNNTNLKQQILIKEKNLI